MGMFDDLIPAAGGAQSAAERGMFDDLIPEQPTASEPQAPSAAGRASMLPFKITGEDKGHEAAMREAARAHGTIAGLPLYLAARGIELALPSMVTEPVEANMRGLTNAYPPGEEGERERARDALTVGAVGVLPTGAKLPVAAGAPAIAAKQAGRVTEFLNPEIEAARKVRDAAAADLQLERGQPRISPAEPDYPGGTSPVLGRMTPRPPSQPYVPAKDVARGSPISPQELSDEAIKRMNFAHAAGQDARLMDTGGPATGDLLRTAANISPTARGAIEDVVHPRFEGQSARTIGWLKDTLGLQGDTYKTLDTIKAASRSNATPAYKAAYAEGSEGIWDDTLAELTQSPHVKEAMRYADKKVRTMQTTGRETPPTSPFQKTTATTTHDVGPLRSVSEAARKALANTETETVVTPPTLEFWDYTKRALDDQISALYRKGNNSEAADVRAARDAIVKQLDAAVPSFKSARGFAAEYFDASDAVSAGENIVHGKWRANEIAGAMEKMTPNEKKLVQEGFISEYLRDLAFTGDRRDITKTLAASEGEREKLAAMLGPKKALEFEARLYAEKILDRARTALGNSTTTRQAAQMFQFGSLGRNLTAAGVVGAATGFIAGGPAGMLTAALMFGAKQFDVARQIKVAENVARMLTSNDPAVYKVGLQAASQSKFLPRLRAWASATDAEQAEALSRMTAVGATAPDDGEGR